MNTDAVLKEIAKRSRKIDRYLDPCIDIVKRYDLVPKQTPARCEVFVNERSEVQHVVTSDSKIPYNRRGRIAQMVEDVDGYYSEAKQAKAVEKGTVR